MDVVIVSYNTRDLLCACIEAVCPQQPRSVTVVDNASTDGSAGAVRRRYPDVNVIANADNPGFGAGANQALARATDDLVLVLNGDTAPHAGALDALRAAAASHPKAALIAPRLNLPDGRTQRSCYPFPGTLDWLLENDPIGAVIGRVPVLRSRYQRWMPADRERAVPWAMGAALLVRRWPVVNVGGFDESFFMYFEEVDLAYRLALAGWEVRYAPDAVVDHVSGASTAQCRTRMLVQHYASCARFYDRYYSTEVRDRWLRIMRLKMRLRLYRDVARLRVTRDAARRQQIREQIAAWRTILVPVRSRGDAPRSRPPADARSPAKWPERRSPAGFR